MNHHRVVNGSFESAYSGDTMEADILDEDYTSLCDHINESMKMNSVMKKVDETFTGKRVVVHISYDTREVKKVDIYNHSFTRVDVIIKFFDSRDDITHSTTAEYRRNTTGGTLVTPVTFE